jgi:phosphate acyltransferase
MKIALDAMGGDHGPPPNLAGARLALAAIPQISTLFLVGAEEKLRAAVDSVGLAGRRVEIVPAAEVVGMSDEAVGSVRQRKNVSINVSTRLVRDRLADAVVSAGHTGAAVASSFINLGRLSGVYRPGLLAPFPNEFGLCHLIDAGANIDSKPEHLVQQAIMGWTYVKHVNGRENPKVGLMSNGEEDSKGNRVTKEVFACLAELKAKGLNFVGNIEGRDLLSSPVDVAVCDGFVGNVLLKGCEGTAKAMSHLLKTEIMKSPLHRFGAWLARGALKAAAHRMSYENYGGSPLLGVNGVTIIAHGSSNATAIKNAIRVAAEAVAHEINPHIEESIARFLPKKLPVPA